MISKSDPHGQASNRLWSWYKIRIGSVQLRPRYWNGDSCDEVKISLHWYLSIMWHLTFAGSKLCDFCGFSTIRKAKVLAKLFSANIYYTGEITHTNITSR